MQSSHDIIFHNLTIETVFLLMLFMISFTMYIQFSSVYRLFLYNDQALTPYTSSPYQEQISVKSILNSSSTPIKHDSITTYAARPTNISCHLTSDE